MKAFPKINLMNIKYFAECFTGKYLKNGENYISLFKNKYQVRRKGIPSQSEQVNKTPAGKKFTHNTEYCLSAVCTALSSFFFLAT